MDVKKLLLIVINIFACSPTTTTNITNKQATMYLIVYISYFSNPIDIKAYKNYTSEDLNMNRNESRDRDGRRESDGDSNPFFSAGALAAGVAAIAGGLYWFSRGSQSRETSRSSQPQVSLLNIPILSII